jgi:hypothetical protein
VNRDKLRGGKNQRRRLSQARVQDFGLPSFLNRLVSITEFSFKTGNFDE